MHDRLKYYEYGGVSTIVAFCAVLTRTPPPAPTRARAVVEGNHVWNYATHPTVGEDPSSWPYFPGGSKTIEPWFFGSLTNDQGMGSGDTANISFKGGFNRFIVMRGNIVRNNGGIIVRGTSANVLLDSNLVELSDVGIHVNLTTTEGGVVLVNNTEPPNVPANYNPYQVGL